MMDHKTATSMELMTAFLSFNQDSTSLQESYQRLEHKIDVLNSQLAESNRERLQELAEKKIVADRLASIIAALPIGLITINTSGDIVEWNLLAETMLACKLSGKTWDEIVRSHLSLGCLVGGDLRLTNGITLQISIHNLYQEGKIIMLHDITEAKKIREQLNNNEKLSAIGEMTAGLVHQIRTPLTSAFLYLEKIGSEMASGRVSDEIGITALWKLKESLNSINSTVNDLLLYSKNKQTSKESVWLSEFIDSIQENVADELDKFGANLIIENEFDDCEIYLNRQAMQGAIHNLVTNALQAGSTLIDFTLKDVDGDCFELLVNDNGCGITESEKSSIFSPFFTTKSQGHGFGLSIVKSVVELNGGSIDLLNSTPEGSCFSVKFPYGDCIKTPLKSCL